MNTKLHLILTLLVSALLPFAHAQTSNTTLSTQNATVSEEGQEVIQLSEFEITAVKDDSYFASETLTGTRIRAEIKELPFNVSVITSELIEDFDMSDVSDALSFTASATDNDITPSAVNLRGFSGGTIVNGMSFFGLLMRSNTERIEVIKGPYAAIYGKTDPGGLVNYVTKQPSAKPKQSLTLTAGTQDYIRGMLSLSGPLTNQLHYNFNIGYNRSDGTQDFVKSWRKELSGSIDYLFSKNTKLHLEYTEMHNYSSRPSPVVWVRDRTSNQYIRKYTEDFYFNRSGPSSDEEVHQAWNYRSVYGFFDHKLNNIFSARIAAVWWDRDSPALAMGGTQYFYSDTIDDPLISGIRPNVSDIVRDNLQVQADLLASFKTGKVTHKILGSLMWLQETDHSSANNLPDITPGQGYNDPTIMNKDLYIKHPVWLYPKWSSGEYSDKTRDRKQTTTISSLFLSYRLDILRRIHLFAGGRFDWVDIQLDDYLTKNVEKQTTDNLAPQAGATVDLNQNITAYVSTSKSYSPQSQARTNSQELYPNEEGLGLDFGFKTSFFDKKLHLTVGGFFITKSNVLQSYTDENGIPVTDVTGEIKSDGAELELNWQLTPSLQIVAGGAWMDNRVTKNNERPWTVGHLVARGPAPYNYGLAIIYRFKTGFLKGLTLRADVKGQGSSLGEVGSGEYTRGGVTYQNDNRINIKQPGFTILNAGASYSFRTGSRSSAFRHTISLNLKNLTDKEYSTGNWIPKDGFTASLSYSLKH